MIVSLTTDFGPEDGWAFNQLSIWCKERLINFDGAITGTKVEVVLEGDERTLRPILDYLTERKMGVI